VSPAHHRAIFNFESDPHRGMVAWQMKVPVSHGGSEQGPGSHEHMRRLLPTVRVVFSCGFAPLWHTQVHCAKSDVESPSQWKFEFFKLENGNHFLGENDFPLIEIT